MRAYDHAFPRDNDRTCAVADYPRSNMIGKVLTQNSRLSANIMQSYEEAASFHALSVLTSPF